MTPVATSDYLNDTSGELRPQPPRATPGEDGSWWLATKHVAMLCPNCGPVADRPAVQHYVPALDWTGSYHLNTPGWLETRWRCWRECQRCDWHTSRLAVATSEIDGWQAGPWQALP